MGGVDRLDPEETGYRVLVQAWDFVPGANWTQHMHDGTIGAARYNRGPFRGLSDIDLRPQPEWLAAWQQDPPVVRSES